MGQDTLLLRQQCVLDPTGVMETFEDVPVLFLDELILFHQGLVRFLLLAELDEEKSGKEQH